MNPLLILSIIERAAAVAKAAHDQLASLKAAAPSAGISEADVAAAIARGQASADKLVAKADEILDRLGPASGSHG